ncbi:hypothetical protein [Streptomyces sp. R33]|uniref:Uncharacterized protein n=1 Tax=Streptomyces sp. R33 TaxID=3238629 RepID=A0AB39YAL1_9ACTN
MGVFKTAISISELRQRNEQTQQQAATQKQPEQPKPAPKKG